MRILESALTGWSEVVEDEYKTVGMYHTCIIHVMLVCIIHVI